MNTHSRRNQKPNVITLGGSSNGHQAVCETLGVNFEAVLHRTITEPCDLRVVPAGSSHGFQKTLLEIFLERNQVAAISLQEETPIRVAAPYDSGPDWETEPPPPPPAQGKPKALTQLADRLGIERSHFMAGCWAKSA